jgi:dienelactone hydrolase
VAGGLALFHHALGQTPGFLEFAGELRSAGHTVHAPDLYDGKTFDVLDDGLGYAPRSRSTRSSSAAWLRQRIFPLSSSTVGSRSA